MLNRLLVLAEHDDEARKELCRYLIRQGYSESNKFRIEHTREIQFRSSCVCGVALNFAEEKFRFLSEDDGNWFETNYIQYNFDDLKSLKGGMATAIKYYNSLKSDNNRFKVVRSGKELKYSSGLWSFSFHRRADTDRHAIFNLYFNDIEIKSMSAYWLYSLSGIIFEAYDFLQIQTSFKEPEISNKDVLEILK